MKFTSSAAIFSALTCASVAHATVLHSLTECCGFGFAIAPVADLDGDGIVDLVVGAGGNGTVHVYSGKTGQSLFTATLPGSNLGASVGDAGDVNGDGVSDVIAGAAAFQNFSGTARVFSGRDGSPLLTLNASGLTSTMFGYAVAGLGDVNNDGRGDLLVTAPGGLGEAKVISGLDGSTLYILRQTANTMFGGGAGRIRDLNGDGADDFAIGVPHTPGGKLYVYSGRDGALLFSASGDVGADEFGTFAVSDAGDVNADGKHDIYVGDSQDHIGIGAAYVFSGADGSRLLKLTGSGVEGFGRGGGAGDVDGDGHADLIIGANTYSGGGLARGGRALLYSGRDGSLLTEFVGLRAGGEFGFSAVALGDTDSDRRIDFAISSFPVNRVDIVGGSVLQVEPAFTITSGISGNWYDPLQNGHGIQFEMLTPSVVTAFWFTFDNAGNEVWIVGAGSIEGNRVVMQANRSAGGRFPPNFIPASIVNVPWGTLTFTFSGCNAGRVDWISIDQAFTLTGSMPLQRLTTVLDTHCP